MRPSGLPAVVILETRAHYEFHDLPDELQAELSSARVWFMARPARIPQLIGSFAAIWDDVLPPLPDEVWQPNLALIRDALTSDSSQTRV